MRSVEAHQTAVAALFPAPRTVTVDLLAARGAATATDILASISLPPFTNSAMDGYAVRAGDLTRTRRLPVVDDIPAGRTDQLTLAPGTAHRIMTGSPLPAGADCVIPVERTNAALPGAELIVERDAPASDGQHLRHSGEDIASGQLAIPAKTVVAAPHIGLLAALGISEVSVIAPLRVLVLSTGSELMSPGTPLAHGQIYESNAVMLAAAIADAGAQPTIARYVPDDPQQLRERLAASGPVDLVITSGGVSAGAYEVVKDAFAREATMEFVKVAMQPGMPQGSGTVDVGGTPVPIITLPGNPVSVQVSFEVFVRPPLRAAMGLPAARVRTRAKLTDDLNSPLGKRQFRRGLLTHDADGEAVVSAIGPPGSHHLRFLASANCLLDISPDVTAIAAGSAVEAITL